MTTTSRELDDILTALHDELEAGASIARVHEISDAHPDVRDDILSFAGEWSVSNWAYLWDNDENFK